MPTTVGSHSVAAFVNPSNGDALDADIVKGNDNTLRTSYVAHDADPGVHFQSSVLASRPAAGTAGRKWLTTDDGPKLWYDTGSVWAEIGYVPTSGSASLTNVTISGSLAVDTTTLVVDNANNRVGIGTATPGVALDVVGAARVSNALTVTAGGLTVTAGGLTVSAGGATITGNSTITGTLGGLTGLTVASGGASITGNSTITGTLGGLTGLTVTGTATATTFSGSGASLTNLPSSALTGNLPALDGSALTNLSAANLSGTLPAISGANLTNLNATNISSGTLDAARLPSIVLPSLTSGSNALSIVSSATFFLDLGSGNAFVLGNSGSSVSNSNWYAPAGKTSYGNNNDQFLEIEINGTAYFIRCEAWT